MLNILVNNEYLELYKETEFTMEFKPWIWSDKVSEPYSTDFQIPQTRKNLNLLGFGDMEDAISPIQNEWIDGLLVNDNKTAKIHIQVVSCTENDITIFVVEFNPLKDLLSKKMGELLVDTPSTIYEWSAQNGNNFPYYDRGNDLTAYSQLHPSRTITQILRDLEVAYGLTYNSVLGDVYPSIHGDTVMVAQKKNVCPQNHKQCLSGYITDGGYFSFYGGQHVCNDCEGDPNDQYTTITFNRDCTIRATLFYTYFSRKQFDVDAQLSIEPFNVNITVGAKTYTNHTEQKGVYIWHANKGTTFRIKLSQSDKFDKKFNLLLFLDIYDYEVVEDDYGTELKYRYPNAIPRMDVYTYGGGTVTTYQTVLNDGKYYIKYDYNYSLKGDSTKWDAIIEYPKECYVYFGYYANIDREKTVNELLYTLAWINEKKLKITEKDITLDPYKVIHLTNPKNIDNKEFTTSLYGKMNYLSYANGKKTFVRQLTNKWLADEKDVKTTAMLYADGGYSPKYGYVAKIDQYTDFDYDETNKTYTCKYNDIEGFFIGRFEYVIGDEKITPLYVGSEILADVTQIIIITITTTQSTDFRNGDFLEMDGRLYITTEVNRNEDSKTTTIKGILVNNTQNLTFNDNGELATN